MTLTINFQKSPAKNTDTAILPVFTGQPPSCDDLSDSALSLAANAIKNAQNFKANAGQSLTLYLPESEDFTKLILLGCGEEKNWNAQTAETTGGKLYPALKSAGTIHAAFLAGSFACADNIAAGCKLRSYNFDHYKKAKDDAPKAPEQLDIISAECANIAKAYTRTDQVINGVFTARDFVNEAPNILYPDAYANQIKDLLKPLGVDVEILDDKKMEKLGMGGIMAVGQGSQEKPRMVIMRWNGAPKSKDRPVALVGKGVTFDTGGISIKPAASMDEMKMDMAGSAAVVGTMHALALRNAKTNVVGIVGLAENMPSSNAFRPGDIISTYAGKTIEVLNTDAEGRLVLADALAYVQEKHDPSIVIDLATLTGAIMVALGHEYCGAFVNNDDLWTKIDGSSKEIQEKFWRMPLDEIWTKEMESTVADLRNLGKSRMAGACTAAAFLGHFIDEGRSWAHLDIAGTAWIKSDKATSPKFGTGFAVRTLEQLIYDHYEER